MDSRGLGGETRTKDPVRKSDCNLLVTHDDDEGLSLQGLNRRSQITHMYMSSKPVAF